MNAKRFRIGFVTSLMLVLIQGGMSYAQEEGKVIVVSSKVGEVIDREERDTYQLFQSFSSYQSAQFLELPDGSYNINITYLEGKASRTQVWRISRHELVENYQKVIDTPGLSSASGRWNNLVNDYSQLMDRPSLKHSMSRREWNGPIVDIETTNGYRLRGTLHGFSDDSIALSGAVETHGTLPQQASLGNCTMNLNDVSRLSLPRKSSCLKGMKWGLIPLGLGLIIGAASSDESSWLCPSPRAIVMGLGVFSGVIVTSIGGSVGALKGVDVDVPWEGKSEVEKLAILSKLRAGKYRSRNYFKISPWAGVISPHQGKAAAAIGGRLRYYFTSRSGLEVTYARTGWFSRELPYHDPNWSRTERSKVSYLSGGFFIYPIRKRSVKPFFSWGWGRTSTETNSTESWQYGPHDYSEWEYNSTDKYISINLSGGVEIPVTNYLSLEGRLEDIWALGEGHHTGFQLGMTMGPKR